MLYWGEKQFCRSHNISFANNHRLYSLLALGFANVRIRRKLFNSTNPLRVPFHRLGHQKTEYRLTFLAMLDKLSTMTTKSDPFGQYLQATRNRLGLSLRAVEDATGISNAYLSQLEQGRIKQPSPLILHKLSELYKIPYADLFRLVGYPVIDDTTNSEIVGQFSRIGPITKEEEESLAEYLRFLRTKGK